MNQTLLNLMIGFGVGYYYRRRRLDQIAGPHAERLRAAAEELAK